MNAYDKIEALAREKIAKGEVQNLAAGIAQAAADNPELYAQYRTEFKAGMRPTAPTPVTKVMPTKSLTLQKIEMEAVKLRKHMATEQGVELSEADSINAVLTQQPALYEAYRTQRRWEGKS